MTISELEAFFNSREIPKTIQLRKGEKIVDTKVFLHSHLLTVKANTERTSAPFLERLIRLKEAVESQ